MTDLQPSLRLRVFLADDHPIVLDGMKALIAADEKLELVGDAVDGPTALRRSMDLQPDVAVLDISMPGMNGIEVARKLIEGCPHCRVLVLTVHEDAAYLRQVLDIGVLGYLLKRSATEELSRGIHTVAGGNVYLDPAIASHPTGLSTRTKRAHMETHGTIELSPREIEVARLTAAGHSTKTIALKLQVGVKSVETYKTRYMTKLGFQSRVELVNYAISKGWLGES